jgi:hypothetical protein
MKADLADIPAAHRRVAAITTIKAVRKKMPHTQRRSRTRTFRFESFGAAKLLSR